MFLMIHGVSNFISSIILLITTDCNGTDSPIGISYDIKAIPDSALTSSSSHGPNVTPNKGRLYQPFKEAWVAGYVLLDFISFSKIPNEH